AIRTSPAIHRLASDPLAIRDARRDGDDVVMEFPDAAVTAELEDSDGHVVTRAAAREGRLRVPAPDPVLDPRAHRVVATWSHGGLSLRRAWRVVDLVGTAMRDVLSSSRVEAGAPFAPRVVFRNTKTGAPVVGRRERIALRRDGRVLAEAAGVTDAAG